MPAPFDPQLTLYNRVWAILEASAAFTSLVKQGCRIKSTNLDSASRDRAMTAAGDYPKVRIDVADDSSNLRPPRPFNTDPLLVDYGIPMVLNVEIKTVHDSTLLANQTAVEAAIRGAILSQDAKLGLTWVTSYEDRGIKRTTEKSPDTGGTERTISRHRLVVNARPMRSQFASS